MSKPVHSRCKPYHSRLIADTYITRLSTSMPSSLSDEEINDSDAPNSDALLSLLFTVVMVLFLCCPIFYQWVTCGLPALWPSCVSTRKKYIRYTPWNMNRAHPNTDNPASPSYTSWHNSGRPTTNIFNVPGTCHTRECLPRDDCVHV